MWNRIQEGYDGMVGDKMKWGSGNQERHILSLVRTWEGRGKKKKKKSYMIVFKFYKQNGS
jgi:hypothetical protein